MACFCKTLKRTSVSLMWRYDELICDEINVPQEKPEAKFNLNAFSDSSWQIASLLAAARVLVWYFSTGQ